ncbi:MAG: hypothetical protein ACE144_18990 [Thermodesulfobacteriota bacterium]
MRLEPDQKVSILVVHSKCPLLRKGDVTCLEGPLLDYRHSTATCITALLGIYPWVMASRFGIESKKMDWKNGYQVWCPEKLVRFKVMPQRGCRRKKVLRKVKDDGKG